MSVPLSPAPFVCLRQVAALSYPPEIIFPIEKTGR